MRKSDIDTLHADAMISEPQHAAIIARYALDDHDTRIGAIFAMIGAALCMAGVALVISANWAEIGRLVKIAVAVLLLLGLHAGGVLAKARAYPRLASALHVAGSVMFLLSIALVGQAYNLSSWPPNAILLWTLGIALLPWLLGSRAQFLLLIGALVTWLAMESQAADSWLYLTWLGSFSPALMTWIGALVLASGALLHFVPGVTRLQRFDVSAQTVGTVMLSLGLLLCVAGFEGNGFWHSQGEERNWARSLPLWVSMLSVAIVAVATLADRAASVVSRAAWAFAVTVAALLPWWVVLSPSAAVDLAHTGRTGPLTWVASAALFAFALVQIQRGVMRSSRSAINLGIAFVAFNIAVVYFRLFGSMMHTGITFVVTGALLVVLAWLLERWRRRLNAQMAAKPASEGGSA